MIAAHAAERCWRRAARGANAMQNVAENLLQSSRNASALPVYDDGSIWQHMSDALHQSLYRVLTLLIAVLPGNSCILCRAAGLHCVRHGDFVGAAALPDVAQIRSAPGAAKAAAIGRHPARPRSSLRASRSGRACCSGSSSAFRPSTLPMQPELRFRFRCCPISRMRWARRCCWLRVF